VGINLDGYKTVNMDGTRGTEGFITLGHELKHAQDITTGKFSTASYKSVLDFDGGKLKSMNVREINTRMFENRLRLENGLMFRALPITLLK
jgi:hypothetical protein